MRLAAHRTSSASLGSLLLSGSGVAVPAFGICLAHCLSRLSLGRPQLIPGSEDPTLGAGPWGHVQGAICPPAEFPLLRTVRTWLSSLLLLGFALFPFEED